MGLQPLNEVNSNGRTRVSDFISTSVDDVDALIKLMTKYTPKDYWFVTIGYINNVDLKVTVNPTKELEDYGRSLGDENIDNILDSPGWKAGKMKHPHAERDIKGVTHPSTIYKMKTYTCQWLSREVRNDMKADNDADLYAAYKKHGLDPANIPMNDKRGLGWNPLADWQYSPFEEHEKTKTKRYVIYRKANCFKDSPSQYFINVNNNIKELTKDQVNFYLSISNNEKTTIAKNLAAIEDESVRNEIASIQNLYEFKGMDLKKITFLNCTCVDNGENVRLTYINKNAVPDGIEPGKFEKYILDEFI